MTISKWMDEVITQSAKKPFPILSFPGIQLMGVSVKEMIMDAENQAKCMKVIADHFDCLAAVSLMDLSVEAEAFGSEIKFTEDEVPTVIGSIVNTQEEAQDLKVPKVGKARAGLCVKAIEIAKKLITDRPVFGGIIGPFSLSGRLMDMTEIMVKSLTEP